MSNQNQKKEFIFSKRNYRFLLLSLAVTALGFIIMVGGGSEDPNVFNPEIFNFQRIRLAPTIVLMGFGLAIYSILMPPKKNNECVETLIWHCSGSDGVFACFF